MNNILKIEKLGKITKFTNYSNMNVIISILPIKPKRKYIDIFLIRAREFHIYEDEIDMTKISIRFE